MDSYRYLVEVHILPTFGDHPLISLTPEEIARWEIRLVADGLSRRTARNARATLITALADAVPRYIPNNPAARRKGKGKKGQHRIERLEKAGKVWASPLEVLLIAERAAALSGSDTDFTVIMTLAYTGMRWSEIIGLPPTCIRGDAIDVHWKLYELNGRFYRGRPKDGSMRTVAIPPFLQELLTTHLASGSPMRCTCVRRDSDDGAITWCGGAEYAFLGPQRGHFRRSNYSGRVVRPSADGWHPQRKGMTGRPRMPVLVDLRDSWPGSPLPPWPAAVEGESYEPPQGRGRPRITDDARLASWLPIRTDLTPHGLRHGYQTWMDEAGVSYVLQSHQMGHEVPGMRGVYGHVSPGMLSGLRTTLQGLWSASLSQRASLSPRSSVAPLHAALSAFRGPESTPAPGSAPRLLPKSDT
jgi:integrase